MMFNNYLPPKIYTFLVKVAEENKLSMKEVERIFLTKVATDLGFFCEHFRIGYAKEDPDHKPYCKDCWTRMKTVKPPTYRGKKLITPGQFSSLETFLDIHYRDVLRRRTHKLDLTDSNEKTRISSSGLINISRRN